MAGKPHCERTHGKMAALEDAGKEFLAKKQAGIEDEGKLIYSKEEDTKSKKKLTSSLSNSRLLTRQYLVGAQSLLVFVVLGLACVVSFSSRLFAVIRFESIIHEFDPWYVCMKTM